jgi:hypothetical protein
MSSSGDRSSDARKRALRLLARQHFAEYTSIYEEVRPAARTPNQARDWARTQLRSLFPVRYLELYAQEKAGPGTDIPADIRSKSWQRALARLADLCAPAYRKLFAQFRADGMSPPRGRRPRHGRHPRSQRRPLRPAAHRGMSALTRCHCRP